MGATGMGHEQDICASRAHEQRINVARKTMGQAVESHPGLADQTGEARDRDRGGIRRSRAMIRYRDSSRIRESGNSRDAKGEGDGLAKAAILKQKRGRDSSPVGTVSNKGERVRTGRAAG